MIIPIFINNRGCPHRCIFCNEKMIAGDRPEEITASYISETVTLFLGKSRKKGNTQIAFYGGNFTGMDRAVQERFLGYAEPFIKSGQVDFLRISTRPDAIDEPSIELLKAYNVRAVEIGVQSMDDEVLALAQRGHTAADVIRAVAMLKENRFETGVHLMAGLPGDNEERFKCSVDKVIELAPSSVRIHPVIVFRNTELAKMQEAGIYTPLEIDEAVSLCKYAVVRFQAAGIPVIRLGLQATGEMEKPGSILGGPYHPAFGSLVHESLFADMAASLLSARTATGKKIGFRISPQDSSYLRGQRNRNLKSIMECFGLDDITVISDPQQTRGKIALLENDGCTPQGTGRKKK